MNGTNRKKCTWFGRFSWRFLVRWVAATPASHRRPRLRRAFLLGFQVRVSLVSLPRGWTSALARASPPDDPPQPRLQDGLTPPPPLAASTAPWTSSQLALLGLGDPSPSMVEPSPSPDPDLGPVPGSARPPAGVDLHPPPPPPCGTSLQT